MLGEVTEWQHRAQWLSSAGKGRMEGRKRDALYERHFPAKSSQSRAMPPIAHRDRARIESPLRVKIKQS